MNHQIANSCNTPILFIIFNRPNYAKKVFDAIKKAQTTKLFIAADSPRPHKPQDQK